MDQLIAATVVIGDRSYRIKCAASDEEVVRKTVKTINERIVEFKTQFAGKDMQDYLAMVLLWFATDQINRAKTAPALTMWPTSLSAIEQLLDHQLRPVERFPPALVSIRSHFCIFANYRFKR